MANTPGKSPKTKAAGVIAALVLLAGAIVPPIVSVFRSPSVSASDRSIAAGRDVNIIVNVADRWLDGVKTLLGAPKQGFVAAGETVPVRAGQFEFRFHPIEISPAPGSKPNSGLQATLGIDIKNAGSSNMRLAVIPQWPTLQAEGGIQFKIRGYGITGVEFYNSDAIAHCTGAASNFSLLRPGETLTANLIFDTNLQGREITKISWARVSGTMMVESEVEKKCWKEPFAASKVQATLFK